MLAGRHRRLWGIGAPLPGSSVSIRVYRLVENAEDAQDVVQEAFLNAYQSLDSFKGDSLFFTWLYRIAVNTAISQKRKHRVDAAAWRQPERRNTTIDPLDPSERAGRDMPWNRRNSETADSAGLSRLSPEHRAVLVMKDMEGQKYEKMAEILQVPIGTIRSRLHRARLELRELLKKSEREE